MPIIQAYKGIHPKISPDAFIAENAVIIGDVEIGSQVSIWYGCVIRADVHYIRIGDKTNIQDNCTIHVNRNDGPTIIGSGVTVGHDVLMHACIIEDDAFVGMKSGVLDNATIKRHAMLGAGALLTPNKIIPTGELWTGSPAKLFRPMKQEEIDYIAISRENYVKLSREYM